MKETENTDALTAENVEEGVVIKHRPVNRILLGAAAVLLVLACSAVSLLTAKLATPETVVFDMKGTVDIFMQQSASGDLDEKTAELLTKRFNAALNGSLADWQQSHNAVILVAPAVVSTVKDITPEVRADIQQRMRVSP